MAYLPHDKAVWITLIIVIGVIVGYALYRNYSIRLRHGKSDVFFDRRDTEHTPLQVNVGSESTIDHGKVGDVKGYEADAPAAVPLSQIDVLKNATISHSEIGNIVGVSVKQNKSASDAKKAG